MTKVCVIQSRASSTRLPGKAFLHVAGFPMVVLAAKRASAAKGSILVATTTEKSDDYTAQILENAGIQYFRGSLADPLKRIVDALAELDDSTVVARLTADNVLPDGSFLDEIENEFLQNKYRYLSTTGFSSGLPYGLSVEMMYLSDLREASNNSENEDDREHVTPYIIRKYGKVVSNKFTALNMGNLRCTVDNFQDLISVQALFKDVADPITESWESLVRKLPDTPQQARMQVRAEKFVLGTAQLGSEYGIARSGLASSDNDSVELVRAAVMNGIEVLDTARAYGRSEFLVGKALSSGWESRATVVTKLDPFVYLHDDADQETVRLATENSVLRSCRELKTDCLDVALLHRAKHFVKWDGQVVKCLINLKNSGLCKKIGVSVQDADELRHLLKQTVIEHIQLPYNLLDYRFDTVSKLLCEERETRSVTVHARSAFLQGLLTSKDQRLWDRANVPDSAPVIDWLENTASELGRKNVLDLCVAYVNGQRWIDATVIGLESISQLEENVVLSTLPALNEEEIDFVQSSRPILDISSLDPSLWKAA